MYSEDAMIEALRDREESNDGRRKQEKRMLLRPHRLGSVHC